MIFHLPNPPLCFEIPDEWWTGAGADTFSCTSDHYLWSTPSNPLDQVHVVALTEVAPMLRKQGIVRAASGFREHGNDWEGGRGGMPEVLRAIVSGVALPPVEACKTRKTYAEGFNYKVKHGFHRLYASHAIGFTHLPCVIVHDFRAEPMFGDAADFPVR